MATLEKVMKDLDGVCDYDVKMYIYHSLNGRHEEADTYLNAYKSLTEGVIEDLKLVTNEVIDVKIDDKAFVIEEIDDVIKIQPAITQTVIYDA